MLGGYLFVHFTGEEADGEQIYFSLSRDGLFWEDLNGGQPVLRSTVGARGVRDPFLVRHPYTGQYYLLATDLCIAGGTSWQDAQHAGSRSLIVWQSADLVHWDGPVSRQLAVEGAGCLWAPEAIWDAEQQAFLLFWASCVQLAGEAAPKQRIYGCCTKDFASFSAPFLFQEQPQDIIDTTIVQDGSCFYRFYKNEVTKHVCLERSTSLRGEFQPVSAPVLAELAGVEGPEAYLLPDGKTWCLLVDQFAAGKGYLPLLCSDLAKGDFRVLGPGEYSMGKTQKRHGGVLPLTDEEYLRVRQAYSPVKL